MSLDITDSAALCRLLADPTRLRLLLLLEDEELTVAELTEITGLAQSRVSTHLARLRESSMVSDRRQGTTVFYRSAPPADATAQKLWHTLRAEMTGEQVDSDRERMRQVLRRREPELTWAESVAGQMELHYSPGRTWQATTHALLPLIELGDVLDIAAGDGVLAAMLAPRCQSITCVDLSPRLVAAGSARLKPFAQARYLQGDMHHLPLPETSYDTIFLLHALTYSVEPKQALREVARLLRPGGCAIISTLSAHEHRASVASFDHVNLGFDPDDLKSLLRSAGLNPVQCEISLQESQAPYFGVITAMACKEAA